MKKIRFIKLKKAVNINKINNRKRDKKVKIEIIEQK